MKLRSPLFAPGDSPRKAEKAIASAADCVILDLEDSVAAGAKDAARGQTADIVRAQAAARALVVRVNPRGTPWYLHDLAAVVPAGPAALMLPKCAGIDDLHVLDQQMAVLEAGAGLPPGAIGIIAIVTETAASIAGLAGYGGAPARLRAICFGAEDLSADLGISPRREDGSYAPPVAAARAAVLIAAAAAGVAALDTPWPDPRDPAGLERESRAAAADGFAGKLLIHPAQIAPVTAIFTPDTAQLDWARRVRDAFAARPDAGVMALDGKMIDRPHLKLAQRLLATVD